MNDYVSVVLPTRNRSSLLMRAIQSVRRQTLVNWELIVVDDSSTDDTQDLLRSLAEADPRLIVVTTDGPVGAAAARNAGIARARGEYIGFIDDDAEWVPQKLEIQSAALESAPECGVTYSPFIYYGSDGRQRLVGSRAAPRMDAARQLLRGNFIDTSVVLARRALIQRVEGFDDRLPRLQDWDLLVRLGRETQFCTTPQPLAWSHHTAGSISTDAAALINACDRLASKYRPWLDRREHAAWLATLGHTLMIGGAPGEGRAFIQRAFAEHRTSPRTAVLALLALAGGGFYAKVARMRLRVLDSLYWLVRPRAAKASHVLDRRSLAKRAHAALVRSDDGGIQDVDVVIVNWNGRRWLTGCLAAVARSTVAHRVFIVDNASTDSSADYIRSAYPGVTLIEPGCNLGYAAAANLGLRNGRGRYALVMNPDVLLDPDYLRVLRDRLDADLSIGIAQGKLFSITPGEFDSANGERRLIDSTGHVIHRSRMVVDRGQGQKDNPEFAHEASIFSSCGAAMFLRRSMLEQIAPSGEYFAESFFAYKEDIDLGWRARLLGWDVRYVPGAEAHHVRGVPFTSRGWKQMSLAARRHSWKNHYLLMIRNDRTSDVLRSLPWILGWEVLRIGHALMRDPQVLKAYLYLAREIRDALRVRRDVFRRRRTTPAEIRAWFGASPVRQDVSVANSPVPVP